MFNLITTLSELVTLHPPCTTLSTQSGETPSFIPSKEARTKKFLKNVEAKKIALQKEANHIPKWKKNHVPQSFYTNPVYLKLAAHVTSVTSDLMLDKLEGLASLYLALADCNTQRSFIGIITLYTKTHCSRSITNSIMSQCESLFEMSPQSSDTEKPKWLTLLSKSLTDWKLVVANPAFQKVSRIISMMVALGVLDKTPAFHLGGLNMFSVAVYDKQVNATDLVDALLETVTFFAEGAYKCFTEGSLTPLLYSSSAIVEIEREYIQILSLYEHARNGNLQKFASMDEATFDHRLAKLVVNLEDMYKSTPNGAEKKILHDRWRDTNKIMTEFESSRIRGGLRAAPFCIKTFGESSVGKSSFTDYIMGILLKANDFACTDDHIITLAPEDKHMSNMRTYVSGIKIDDYGNSKLDFVDIAPSDWIIQICNNIKRYAIMADLANKGKISIEPKIVTITTNVEDLLAHQVSNEPVSIARRCDLHVDLKVRPEFCLEDADGKLTHMLDSKKVFAKYGDSDEIQDLWLITIRDLVIIPSGVKGSRKAPSFRFKDSSQYTNIDIFTFLKIAIKKSKDHHAVQNSLVKQQTNMATKVPWCPTCNGPKQLCDHVLEPQFGSRLAHHLHAKADEWSLTADRQSRIMQTKVEDVAVSKMLSTLRHFESSPYSRWTNYLPDSWINNPWIKGMIMLYSSDLLEIEIKQYVRNCWLLIACNFALIYPFSLFLAVLVAALLTIFFIMSYATIVEGVKNSFYERIKEERDVFPVLFKQIREDNLKYVCGAIAGFSVIWGLTKTIKAFQSISSVQGNLAPKSVADILARDAEADPWKPTKISNPSITKCVGRMDEWAHIAKRSLWKISYTNKHTGSVKWCSAFGVQTGIFLIPKHMVPLEIQEITLSRVGQIVRAIVDPARVYNFPDTDLALIYIHNSGAMLNTVEYFAVDPTNRPVPATILALNKAMTIDRDTLLWHQSNDVSNGINTFSGSYYELTQPTYAGLCMAMLVSDAKTKHILGFHVGGVGGQVDGCAASLLKGELKVGLANLLNMSKTFIAAPQSSPLSDTLYDKKISLDQLTHYKSPLMFIPEDSAVLSYGPCTGKSTYTSKVIESPTSAAVTTVCGKINNYGPPQFRPIRPWSESLQNCCKPSIGFPTSQVDHAIEDYLATLKEVFDIQQKNGKYWSKTMKPLTDVVNVSGENGVRFVDGMNASTSMGFGIGGPKEPHLIELDPEGYKDYISCPRIFTEDIMQNFHDAEATWLKGSMVNCIFGSALKDEPTLNTKSKVRVFQAAPIVLQLAIRKYFLPVARFLSVNPLASEIAVGINSAGPEWQMAARHMYKHGKDRIIAGDYSKYDLRMPAQLVQSAFAMMIEIAVWSGNYTPDDIKIMQGVAYEVSCPLVAFNGDLLRFLGTNPSGQNMTVYINSLVNGLLHRLGFYSCYDDQQELNAIDPVLSQSLGRDVRFGDIAAMLYYGDDAKGSVRRGFDKFNHISFANYLADHDMKFTMPDKTSEPVEFLTDDTADFLKRKNYYFPELDCVVGKLAEDSIFKSLQSSKASKVLTPIEVASQNVDGALREWFYYGKEHFNMRLQEMKEVTQLTPGLVPKTLNLTFEDRIDAWYLQYTA